MPRPNQRKKIIEVARKIANSKSVMDVSLDAVAREAGISKGGVLYHFPTKNALLVAIIDDSRQQFESRALKFRQSDSEPGSAVRSYLRASIRSIAEKNPFDVAVLLAAAHDRELLAPMRAELENWHALVPGDRLDPMVAQLVMLATDGIWLREMFGLNIFSSSELGEVVKYLLSLTRLTPKKIAKSTKVRK